MSRINTNVNALIGQRILAQNNQSLTKSMERLSTGLKINRGADGPAGLIAAQKLGAERVALTAALGNAERADQIVNIAEGGLQEISNLLLEVQSLVSQTANSAGLSTEEKEANQLQVDAILQTIDRIASTTSFAGAKLLNGSYDFNVSAVAGTVADYKINGAKLGSSNLAVTTIVTASAQHAGLFLSTAGALNLSAANAKFVVEVAGTKGAKEFSFASGTSLANVATGINAYKSVTGISATASGTGLVIKSTEFGSDQFVSFNILNRGGQAGTVLQLSSINENRARTTGTSFTSVNSAVRDEGQDVAAIINGVAARGKGKIASINTEQLDISLELTTAGAWATGAISALTIYGGGAKFNLGPTIDMTNQVRLGIGNVAARNLGSSSLGYLDSLGSGKSNSLISSNDLSTGQQIVSKAVDQISGLRGRLGAFQSNVVQSSINSLGVALENTSAAESVIRDTDFARETAQLTRAQIMVQAATSALGVANSTGQSVLQLLR